MSYTTKDNSKEVLSALEKAIERGLEAIGLTAEGHAKRITPVDTGRLRNSISHATDGEAAYIGTNVEYAPYVELGSRGRDGKHILQRSATEHGEGYTISQKGGKRMLIHGLQKLTLLDFPTKVACTVFFGGCNFRCPFCHNASLVTHIDNGGTQTDEQVLSFLKKRQGLLDGVCVTGGEPLLQPELPAFLRRIKEMGFAVKLDTNGSNPAALKALVGEGLVDYVAMDIKNAPDRYAETVGIPNFDVAPIAESVAFLLSDAVDYEFRTTVVKEFHRVEDIEAAARFIRGAKRYFLQNFEDSGDLIQTGLSAVAPETLEAMQKAATPYIQYIGVRGI